MRQNSQYRYEFPAGVPLESVPPGTNLLVVGPGRARDVALGLSTPAGDEGTLLVSTALDGRSLLDRYEAVAGPPDRSRLGVVDCTGGDSDQQRFEAHLEPIAHPGDLTGIKIEFSMLYETLAGQGIEGIRIGLFSASEMAKHADLRDVSRFVHMLTGRVIATDDLGVVVVDTATDDRVVEQLARFCDARVDVREEPGLELRVQGLADQPGEWTDVTLGRDG
jgi:uncharacterized cupin superfamily protein